jgi:cell division protein FtsB
MARNAVWLFIVALVLLLLFLPSYTKMQDLRYRNEQYKKQIEDLKKEQARLLEEGRRLKEDPEYVEKVARERMGLIRKGETVYKVVPSQ